MAGYGEVYVEVDANTVNDGIMLLAGSGDIGQGEGDQHGTWWLHWDWNDTRAGYTAVSWYWGVENNHLPKKWTEVCNNPPYMQGGNPPYGNTEAEFNRYLRENNVQMLDEIFADWDPDEKATFAKYVQSQTGWYPNGCVDLI